jgi:GNAT superfamily N-acetyltransferase
MFTLRRVDIEDPLVQTLITSMHEECFPLDARYVQTTGHWWLALAGKVEVAFLGIIPSTHEKNCGYLERVGVLPAFRGNSLQVRLTRRALSYLRPRVKWDWIVTDCRSSNVPSANSLLKSGFKIYWPTTPWGFSDAIYWYRKT